MTFTNEQEIFDIIKHNPNAAMLELARSMAKEYDKYLTGRGLVDAMESLPMFEKRDKFDIKKKIAKTTKDIFERCLHDVNKIFSAKGGVKIYNLPTSKEEEFGQYLSNVRRGMSLTEWVQNIALKAYYTDPMSLIYTEVDKDGKAYPTYKGTKVIYDYALNGRKPEYVVFTLDNDEVQSLIDNGVYSGKNADTVFRVIDDIREYYIKDSGGSDVRYSMEYYFTHGFQSVPAEIVSDIPVYDSPMYDSPLAPIMELAAEFFRDDTNKSLYKLYQMHPREWSVQITCPVCDGDKKHKGEDCEYCGGSGQNPAFKIADRLAIIMPEDGKPSQPGGFYTAPIEAWREMVLDLQRNEDKIIDTHWNISSAKRSNGNNTDGTQTATEILMSERAKEPKLKQYSKWGQRIEKTQVDNIKYVMFNVSEPSTVIYGDYYIHGTIEQLTEYYQTLLAKKAPIPLLDAALRDIYESKYDTNPTQLANHKKLMNVEPFIHSTVNDVMSWNIPDEIKAQKVYYGEWLKTLSPLDIFKAKEDALKQQLATYAQEKGVITPQEPNKVAA